MSCDVNALRAWNEANRNKKQKTCPWHVGTIDKFRADTKNTGTRQWLRKSKYAFHPEQLKAFPVEIDLWSLNRDQAWIEEMGRLRTNGSKKAKAAVESFLTEVQQLKVIKGFSHPGYDKSSGPGVTDYSHKDVLNCNERYFIGRHVIKGSWAPHPDAVIDSKKATDDSPEEIDDGDNEEEEESSDTGDARLYNDPINRKIWDHYMGTQKFNEDIENDIMRLMIRQHNHDQKRLAKQAAAESVKTDPKALSSS
ncbi:uncharacterized protein K489DRAFT_413671 [Dissoconium aciculare CBS 342.82]|uniref:Uncharacterized protein n=1 Tax=Dissoconium aciculare CBS 342.82 TaxID=1314786 RepID=A0A6J3LSJ6_9PEZI|nr:uncharacterized protein K489DRAFT_413671 [Dissoconium aciculare CBS 342.82]KAF1818603.1 hypothetical protein K489DRAFT_413671 [Dissoconium aciculare CBS 342.82]